MTWALIGRADDGGLGNQTAELARHVPPDRVLVVNPGGRRSRGTMRLERFGHVPDLRVFDGDVLDHDTVGWLLDGVDTVFTVECWYSPLLTRLARRAGVRTVVQANPELLVDAADSDLIVLPTTWEAHRVPASRLLPVPVAGDRFAVPDRAGRPPLTLYHPAAPAMLDRNGTDLLLEALRYSRSPFRVLIRGGRDDLPGSVGMARIERLDPAADYWDAYPADADLMVLPRRYGGLSLSMQEAAAVGLPTVSLDVEPQRRWLDPAGLVEATVRQQARMRGGVFDVWTCHPRALARRLDDLAGHPEVVARMRDRALAWAAALDWSKWLDPYRRLLDP